MATNPIGAPIPVDEANDYISNHIATYYETGKYPVKSLLFSAELLRNYLNENPNIENMKFMLAVKPDDAGIENISMIVVGYDAEGNYVKLPGNMVLDHCMPCPYNCPLIGNAKNDHII